MSRLGKPPLRHLLATIALLGGAAAHAEQNPPPMSHDSMAMPAQPAQATAPPSLDKVEPNAQEMSGSMQMTPDESAHATDLGLERPAVSQGHVPPMMPGMDMDDANVQHRISVENLEAVSGNQDGEAWDAQAWFGGDFNKLWLKTEGSHVSGITEGARVEAFWAHAIRPFWDTQLGARYDFGNGPSREWAGLGIQGIAPYWFDLEATLYVGDAGRTAARLKVEYDVYLTQRLVLRPEVELNAYGREDVQRHIGSGLSDGQFELRLRYEFSRRFATYAGYVWDKTFGTTATLANDQGEPATDHQIVAGIQFFF